MTKDHNFKKRVRARCAATGEPYTVARRALLAERGETADDVSAGGTMPPLEPPGDTIPVFISPGEERIPARVVIDEAHDFTDDEVRMFLRMLLGEDGVPLDPPEEEKP
jgi:hypothetical protein